MKERTGISQEGLKVLACLTMLIDHIGAIFFPYYRWMRIIGRLSFPLYCFLLAEGVHYTRNPVKYGLRLLLTAILVEFPYDLLFSGQFTWSKNSVMITLLLGFCAGTAMKQVHGWWKLLTPVPFILLGKYLHGSYGMYGVAMIVMFALLRDIPYAKAAQLIAMVLLSLRMAGFPGHVSIQIYAVAAMLPILLYNGKKHSHNKALQWAFTLFYPVHIVVLLLIQGF